MSNDGELVSRSPRPDRATEAEQLIAAMGTAERPLPATVGADWNFASDRHGETSAARNEHWRVQPGEKGTLPASALSDHLPIMIEIDPDAILDGGGSE